MRRSATLARLNRHAGVVAVGRLEPATINRHCRVITSSWLPFVRAHRVPAFPACPDVTAAFLAHTAELTGSAASVSAVLAALRWYHRLRQLPPTFDTQRVQDVAAGYAKRLGTQATAANVPSIDVIRQIAAHALSTECTPVELRSAAILITMLLGCRRKAEVLDLHAFDIVITEAHIELFIGESKTDKVRHGSRCYISRSSDEHGLCQVLERYLRSTGQFGLTPRDGRAFASPVFRKMQRHRGVVRLHPPAGVAQPHMSAQSAALDIKALLATLGFAHLHITPHGFRSASATLLHIAGGIEMSVLQGQWKTASSALRYIDHGDEALCRPSEAIEAAVAAVVDDMHGQVAQHAPEPTGGAILRADTERATRRSKRMRQLPAPAVPHATQSRSGRSIVKPVRTDM